MAHTNCNVFCNGPIQNRTAYLCRAGVRIGSAVFPAEFEHQNFLTTTFQFLRLNTKSYVVIYYCCPWLCNDNFFILPRNWTFPKRVKSTPDVQRQNVTSKLQQRFDIGQQYKSELFETFRQAKTRGSDVILHAVKKIKQRVLRDNKGVMNQHFTTYQALQQYNIIFRMQYIGIRYTIFICTFFNVL